MCDIKKIIFYTVLIVASQTCYNTHAHKTGGNVAINSANVMAGSVGEIKTELPNVGKNSAERVAKSLDRAVTAGVGVAVGAGLYVVYREAKKGVCGIKNYFSPNKEEQIHEKEVSKRLNILKAEDELYKSLVAHAAEEKNYRGIPCACEGAANKYAAVAGFDALGRMIEEFKRATTKSVWQKCTAW